VVLPPLAASILAEALQRPRPAGATHLFSRKGHSAVDGWSKAKKRLDSLIAQSSAGPLEPWRINDIRTSFPQLAADEAGIDFMVAEACLWRISRVFSGRGAKIWARSEHMMEMRSEALATWEQVLMAKVDRLTPAPS
jgi:hypothetical protein